LPTSTRFASANSFFILIANIEKQPFHYRLERLSRPPALPEQIATVRLDSDSESGTDLGGLVAEHLAESAADKALLFQERRTVEKRYNPYRVFTGWRTESVVDEFEPAPRWLEERIRRSP